MVTVDLGAAPPVPPAAGGALGALPRRLSLTRPELLVVAEHAGGAPLPFEPPGTGAGREERLDDRLGRTPGTGDRLDLQAVLGRLHDPRATLARRGLLVGDVLDEGLSGAIGLLASPRVAVDLDVTVGDVRVRAWHRERGGAVASLATADGIVFELSWFPAERWAAELARTAVLPEHVPTGPSAVPALLDLPYGLVDAAAEAEPARRDGLLSALAAQHDIGLDVVPVLAALSTETAGRLRALVADISGKQTTVAGVVSWLLLADGWHALRTHRTEAGDRLEVRRVEAADLATELAPVLAEVRA